MDPAADPAAEPAAAAAVPDMVPDTPADAPPDAAGKAELTPAEVLALLAAGKDVVNARVKRLKLRGVIPGPVRFKNCVLVSPEFDKVTFQSDVAFPGTTIDKPGFRGAVVFEKGLDLSAAVVLKATFYKLRVHGKFDAGFAEFRGKVAFADCVFHGPARFWEAKFPGWPDFKSCQFLGEADFRSAHFGQGVVFGKCDFRADFLFRGSAVEKKFDAESSAFHGLIDLSKAKLRDFVYLEAIKQHPGQTFAFLNAVAERIRVRPDQLEGRLASERDRRYDDAMQEYGLLKSCYTHLYRHDQEDWAFYRFKVAQRRSRPATWRKPWTVWRQAGEWLFLDIGCGYGTNPLRAVRMAAAIVLGFAVLYAANADLFYTEKRPFPNSAPTDLDNRLMIGFITSVAVFTSGMGGIREIAQGWMNVPVMIESIMGTLLFGLFIVAFSRKVIR